MTDILADIDAAVDGLCADGCGRRLNPDGPSAYWATEACQERWQSRSGKPSMRGAEPAYTVVDETHLHDEEYLRYMVGLIQSRLPPAVPDPTYQPKPTVNGSGYGYATERGWRIAADGPLRFVRQCGTCREWAGVIDGVRPPKFDFNWLTEPIDVMPESLPSLDRCQLCANCRSPHDGPVLLAQYREDAFHGWELRLSAGSEAATARVSRAVEDYPEMAWGAWDGLLHYLIEHITYRDPCSVTGCERKAQRGWDVRRAVQIGAYTARVGKIRLCMPHHYELQSQLMADGHLSSLHLGSGL